MRMGLKTPFFSAFGPLLFGGRAHRKLPAIGEDFSQLQSVFGGHLPKGALAPAKGGANGRRRVFSVEVIFLAFLFQMLWPSCACREVVGKVQAWWRGRKAPAAGSAAYCMARARLPLAVLEKLFSTLAATLERRVLDGERWLGARRVKILDGTGLSVPDTSANQKRWPQPGGQKPGCGLPLRRLRRVRSAYHGRRYRVTRSRCSAWLPSFTWAAMLLLRNAFGNKHDQENHLARGVLDGLEKGDVLLADRGFCSYGLIGVLLARGVDTASANAPAALARNTFTSSSMTTRGLPSPKLFPDETACRVIAFLHAALAFFKRLGIRIQRIYSDNSLAYGLHLPSTSRKPTAMASASSKTPSVNGPMLTPTHNLPSAQTASRPSPQIQLPSP